jgi:methylmalonyl-CoA/ethylmalonyl-CoA epimerase
MNKSAKVSFKVKPHHVGISVPDLEAAIAWYHDMLGFEVAKRMEMGAGSAKLAFVKNGDFYIELFEVKGANPLPESRRYPNEDIKTHGTKHLCLVVDDNRQVAAILKEKGVDIAMDGSERGGPLFIRDNAGTLIEIVPPSAP